MEGNTPIYPLQEDDEQFTTNVVKVPKVSVQSSTSGSINFPSTIASSIELDLPSTAISFDLPSAKNSIEENDEQCGTIKSPQPSTSNFKDFPSTNARLLESHELSSSISMNDLLSGKLIFSIEEISIISENENLTMQNEMAIVQQNEITSNQQELKPPQPKKPRESIESKKNHKCTYSSCEKSFSKSNHLRDHIDDKHLMRKWKCLNCCNFEYTSIRGRDKHRKKNPEHNVIEVLE